MELTKHFLSTKLYSSFQNPLSTIIYQLFTLFTSKPVIHKTNNVYGIQTFWKIYSSSNSISPAHNTFYPKTVYNIQPNLAPLNVYNTKATSNPFSSINNYLDYIGSKSRVSSYLYFHYAFRTAYNRYLYTP